MSRHKCEGTGRPAVSYPHDVYPYCPVCDRQMAAQGPKAQLRFADAWKAVPLHYVEEVAR